MSVNGKIARRATGFSLPMVINKDNVHHDEVVEEDPVREEIANEFFADLVEKFQEVGEDIFQEGYVEPSPEKEVGSRKWAIESEETDFQELAKEKWSNFQGNLTANGGVRLNYEEPMVRDGKRIAQIDVEETEVEASFWKSALVCVVLGANPPLAVFEGFINRLWGKLGIERIARMNASHTLVKFRDETTRDLVLEAGVVHFDRKPVLLRPWSTDLETLRVVNSVLVWMRSPNIGLQYWGLKSLSALVSTIGKPMMMDRVTKEKSMVKFARVLVEVEITDRLPHSISSISERGQLMEQAIEFEWLPTRCSCCKGLGHTASSCKSAQEVVSRPKQQVSASGTGDIRGVMAQYEAKNENKTVVETQKDAGNEVDGDEPVHQGGSKGPLTATTEDTNETGCSTAEKEKTWTIPRKVGGLRKKNSTEHTLKANKFSVLQEKIGLVANKESHKPQNSNGGVFLETKLHSSKIEEMMNEEMDQLVTYEVQIKGVRQTVVLSFVYGRNSLEERKKLWARLQLSQSNSRPWLVAGDFNAVFDYDDRSGDRQISALEVEDSRQWKAISLLTELRFSGSSFTWSNKQKEGLIIFSRLDRIFVNEVWIDSFPDSEGRFNWDTLSDHCFCIIKAVHFQVSGVKPFRYFNMWDKHQDFRSSVMCNWSKPVGGTGLQKIMQKLKRLKPVLIQFNKV
ncbi:uncharacterized protein LOC133779080 [Humulus lupulus]|uniref:uncharacterized protein LOC133779080 n=1 Tax=Humulus lupulus TaxID=3486 RepID=UPI002B4156BC|nr:uncharacterized protein LOC133779080 [Humulus lupulus]